MPGGQAYPGEEEEEEEVGGSRFQQTQSYQPLRSPSAPRQLARAVPL